MKSITALYVRVSTDKQANGLEAQERALNLYCEAHGYTDIQVFRDDGVSGAKVSRPGLNALMAEVEAGSVKSVIVYSFSRFARSTSHLLQALAFFNEHNVSFTSLSEKLDTSSPTGKAVFTILAAISELERATIVERVKNGLSNAKAKGVRLGRPTKVDRTLVRELVARNMKYREIAKLTGASQGMIRAMFKSEARSESELFEKCQK